MTAITVPMWEERDWTASASCAQVDPEAFFPEGGGRDMSAAAKRTCRSCDVKTECLEYALTHGPLEGIWGGTTVRERRRLRRNAA